MKALATKIGKSQKESITVDGMEHLKSVKIGRWNFIARVSYTNWNGWLCVHEGHSASKAAAEKWLPTDMFADVYAYHYDAEQMKKQIAELEANTGNKGSWKRTSGGQRFYRIPYTFTREVTEIIRETR